MMPPPVLQDYRKLGAIGREDIAAASVLVSMAHRESEEQPDLLAWIGFCLALRSVRDGHTCVDFDNIQEWAGGIEIGAPSLRHRCIDVRGGAISSYHNDAVSWRDE